MESAFDDGFDDGFGPPRSIVSHGSGERATAAVFDGTSIGDRSVGIDALTASGLGDRNVYNPYVGTPTGTRAAVVDYVAVVSGDRDVGFTQIISTGTGSRAAAVSISAAGVGSRGVAAWADTRLLVYVGVDSEPETDAAIVAGTAPACQCYLDELPKSFSLSLSSGTHTYYFDYRLQNPYGEVSRYRGCTSRVINSSTGPVSSSPPMPFDVSLNQYGKKKVVKVGAAFLYPASGGTFTWLVQLDTFGEPTMTYPATLNVPMVNLGGYAILDTSYTFAIPPSEVYAKVAARRSSDGVWTEAPYVYVAMVYS